MRQIFVRASMRARAYTKTVAERDPYSTKHLTRKIARYRKMQKNPQSGFRITAMHRANNLSAILRSPKLQAKHRNY